MDLDEDHDDADDEDDDDDDELQMRRHYQTGDEPGKLLQQDENKNICCKF